MSKEESLVPHRRFKEFENSGVWERRKLSKVAKIITGGTPSTKVYDYWHPKEIPWLSSGEVHKKYISFTDNMISKTGLNNSSTKLVEKNSVLIALAGQGKTRGTVAINRIPLSINQSIAAMTFNNNVFPEFIFNNLENRYLELRKIASGEGSRGGLNKYLVGNISVPVPKYCEQKKIGDFFVKMDKLITLHQCKLNKLKKLKSAYLTEMFPAEGERKPKRRFTGFNEAWEQHKLGDVAKRLDNLRIPVAASKRKKGHIPYYGANGIQDHVSGFTHDGENILIAEDGASDLDNYPVRFVEGKIWVNNHAHVFKSYANSADNRFLVFALKRVNITKYLVGGGRAKLNADTLMNIYIKMPCLEEQRKIGLLFASIDHLITLHQRKIDKLKKLKAAYLNEMFV